MTIQYNKWKRLLIPIILLFFAVIVHIITRNSISVKKFVSMQWLFENKIEHKKGTYVVVRHTDNNIKVRVTGAVERPGVYNVKVGTTLLDLLAFTGCKEHADVSNLEKIILEDGKDYYVPYLRVRYGEKININKADVEELCRIPYINKTIAKSIIYYRNKYDGFDSIEEIKEVNGIGDAKFDYIKKYLTIGE